MSHSYISPTNSHRVTRKELLLYAVAALLIAIAWFGSLELRGLFIPDEGRYAEIPSEMLATGDWVTPHLNDLKYFEKPPLQYWMTAASFHLFGEDEWTARLPSAMLGFFALLMVGFTGYRIWGMRTGALAAAMLGGSWAFFLAGQYLTLDMTLSACLTFSLCAFLLAQQENDKGEIGSDMRAWMRVAWAAAALAVLSKGLIGVVLPALTLAIYLLLQRRTAILRRLNPVEGAILFLLIAVPWFVVVQYRNPEFFDFFFIQEHFRRFAEPGHNREGAWWYYIPILIFGLLPWTPALLKSILEWRKVQNVKLVQDGRFSPTRFCVVWAGVIVLFFSVSHSKLPAYILPVWPAMVLVLANQIQIRGTETLKWSAWGVLLSGVLFLGLISMLPGLAKFAVLGTDAGSKIYWLYAAASSLLLSGIAALWSARRRMFSTTVVILIAGTFGLWQMVFGFLHSIETDFTSEELIEAFTAEQRPFHPELPFYSVAQFDDTVPFYLGRTVTLVDSRGELGPGIDAEPNKVIPDMKQFKQIWLSREGQAYAVMRPDMLAQLRQSGLPMTQVTSNKRLVIVSRQPENR
jgi:4-amino-4-deoxy-L-arabinose transferase-like glycosyltransferase